MIGPTIEDLTPSTPLKPGTAIELAPASWARVKEVHKLPGVGVRLELTNGSAFQLEYGERVTYKNDN